MSSPAINIGGVSSIISTLYPIQAKSNELKTIKNDKDDNSIISRVILAHHHFDSVNNWICKQRNHYCVKSHSTNTLTNIKLFISIFQ